MAIVLLATYVAGLFFSLKTHRAVFNPFSDEDEQEHEEEAPLAGQTSRADPRRLSAVLVGVMSEVLVGSISEASEDIGLSEFFVGVFVVAIVGNAAEHWVAVLVAAKRQDGPGREHRDRVERPDRAVRRADPGAASFVVGPEPMALVFNGYELGGLLFAVLIANFVTQEGESNWFEGVQLIALYAVLGLVFYFA